MWAGAGAALIAVFIALAAVAWLVLPVSLSMTGDVLFWRFP